MNQVEAIEKLRTLRAYWTVAGELHAELVDTYAAILPLCDNDDAMRRHADLHIEFALACLDRIRDCNRAIAGTAGLN